MASKANLTLSQKILLAEDIWDSLAGKVEGVTFDDEKEFVESRLNDIRKNKEKLHSWKSVKLEARRLKAKINR
jgi:putative addiction module component (TIGR02574 family)